MNKFLPPIITLILLVGVIMFAIPQASAFEFDNVKDYDKDTKTITITNAFGLGDDIATIRLDSSMNVLVPRGYQQVAEMTFDSAYYYENAFNDMKFYHKDEWTKLNRDFDYKLKTIKQRTVTDYSHDCTTKYPGREECDEQKVLGTHTEDYVEWVTIDKLEGLPKGEVTVGIFTDVQAGDRVEWIPTWFGVEIPEFAVWTESIATGLKAVWKFDEGTGTTASDSLGNYDLTVNSANWNLSGKDGSAYQPVSETVDTGVTLKALMDSQAELTVSLWVNQVGVSTGHASAGIIEAPADAEDTDFYMRIGTNELDVKTNGELVTREGSAYLVEGNWQHIVFISNSTFQAIYHNTTEGSVTDATAVTAYSDAGNMNLFDNAGAQIQNVSIDEMYFWNRTVTYGEIVELFNNNTGIFWDSLLTEVTSNLIVPNDETNTTTLSHTFQCNSTATGTTLGNVTLNIWEGNTVINTSFATITGVANTTNFTYDFTSDGDATYKWNCLVHNTGGDVVDWADANRTLRIDTTAPSLTLVLPTNNDIMNGGTADLNFSVSDAITPVDACWYSVDSGATNTTITSCANTTLTVGYIDYELWLWANDTMDNKASGVGSNFTVVNITVGSAYDALVIELTSHQFNRTINHSGTLNPGATFHYNNTPYYAVSNLSEEYYLSISAPKVDGSVNHTNKSFTWEFNFTFNSNIETFNTSASQQEIHKIILDNCTQGLTTTVTLNFTYANETSLTEDNASQESTFLIWDSGLGITNNRTYTFDWIEQPSHAYCISPIWATVKSDANLFYSSAGYNSRNYYLNDATLNNQSNDITLYLGDSGLTTVIYVKVQDEAQEGLPNHIIKAERYYPATNTWLAIELAETDDFGYGVFHLVEDEVDYKFLIENSTGDLVKTSQAMRIICLDRDYAGDACSIAFTITDELDIWDNVITKDDLTYSLTYNNNTRVVSFSWTDSSGSTPTMNLEVGREQGSWTTYPCDSSVTSTSSTMTCNLTSSGNGEYLVKVSQDSTVLDTLRVYIEDVVATFGLEGVAWSLMFFMTIIMIGLWNPVVSVFLSIFGLIIVQLIGIMAWPLTTTILLALLGLIIITRLRT